LWGVFVAYFLALAVVSPAAIAQGVDVTERGPHHQVVQTISTGTDEQGNTVSVTNSFT
jgi:hypothetical protein